MTVEPRTWWPERSTIPALLAVLVVSAWLYAPGFGGFWLGDDFGHLHQTFHWAKDGRLWTETLGKFAAPADAVGSFYRPLLFVTMSADYALFGTRYWGWFATNLLLHLACVALLVWVVRRAASRLSLDGALAAPVAALAFAVSPLLVEGVMWVSARSDLAVTAIALLCAGLWLAPERSELKRIDGRALVPLLVAIGLGFKESAAVLPLQLLLLTIARWRSMDRTAWLAWAGSALVVGAFFALRAWGFESAWHAYADGGSRDLSAAVQSLPAWWRGAVSAAPIAALAWSVAGAVAALVSLRFAKKATPCWMLAAAFAGAGAGQLLATLLNLGAFAPSGEGGRLLYGPIAWFAVALGVLLARSPNPAFPAHGSWRSRSAVALALLAILTGAIASRERIAQFVEVQRELRALTASIAQYATDHEGTTVLVVPDQRLGVVAARNGQGALVMPPLQAEGLLHLVVPTLPAELPERRDQFAHGLGTRLASVRPQRADYAMLRTLLQPAAPGIAPAIACWSSGRRVIVRVQDSRRPDAAAACRGIR